MKMYDEGEAHLQDVTWQARRAKVRLGSKDMYNELPNNPQVLRSADPSPKHATVHTAARATRQAEGDICWPPTRRQ